MPLSRAFFPIVFNGLKFDRGMQLYEFSSQREADVPLTEYTGAYKDCGRFVAHVERFVRRRVEMVEVPTPKMLLFSKISPEPFISNGLTEFPMMCRVARQMMSRKIVGLEYDTIAPGYYRAAWLPPPELFPSLRPAVFHYPACGYAGVLAEMLGEPEPTKPSDVKLDTVAINIAFLTGYPQMQESVIFVVDESPIYRVTNQEVCSGRYGLESRLVVEYRGECDPVAELARLGICADATMHGQITINYPLPTKENLQRCPTLYTSTMNDLILRHMLSTQQPGSTT